MRQRSAIAINAPLTLSPRTTRCSDVAVKHLLLAQLGGARLVIGNVFCVTGPGRAAAEVNMDAVTPLTPDGVRKVQLALQKKGITPGPIDGKLGPLTKQALRSFQDRYGIKSSGEADNQTLFALGEVDLAVD
jgi:hypothetical protein